ncbi:MAG: hypothetical protein LBR83_02355 [Clostridiales bacterium]|jgi:DNA-binding beta-propeller fold protein YncE|nr:hypothetical protein [Clostridiales bacterium]
MLKKAAALLFAGLLGLFSINLTAFNAEEEPAAVTLLAGMGSHGAVDGFVSARFNLPMGLTGDGERLYIADTYNNLIRTADAEGEIGTLAGSVLGMDAYRFPKGDYKDGLIRMALLNRPVGLAADGQGQLFIADSENHVIRVIGKSKIATYSGKEAGHMDGTLKEARFNSPSALSFDKSGNLYVADTLNHCIRKISSEGDVTTIAGMPGQLGNLDGDGAEARFNCPSGIAVSEDGGRVYVSDSGNHCIRVIENGSVFTLTGVTAKTDEDGSPLGGFADGPAAEALFNLPRGLTLADGMLIVADSGNHRIRAIADGEVITLAGTGEPGAVNGEALSASFNMPSDVYAQNGVLYITDTVNNQIRQMPLVIQK